MTTFGDLFNLYYEKHAKLRTRRPENARYFWSGYGYHWKDTPLNAINRFMLQDWVDELGARSRSAANRAINMMAAIFNWGIRRGHAQVENPCVGVERFPAESRERFLLPSEFIRFRKSLEQESDAVRDFFWLCLLTGARRGNVQSMRWSELDVTLGIWRIPGQKHKNGTSHHVALTPSALALLQRRKQQSNGCEFVFPGKGRRGHLVEPKRAWRRVLNRAGIEDLRMHDLRRTLGSYMAIQGESSYVIGKALGHKDPRSTAAYARLDLEPVRRALAKAEGMFR